MSALKQTRLPRAVLRVSGEDRRPFLQGLISNDVEKAQPGHAIWAAFLTPQGKFLWDLFICDHDGAFYLDVDADTAEAFRKKLSMYKLRSKVAVELLPDLSVFALFGGEIGEIPGIGFLDPRIDGAGARVYAENPDGLPAQAVDLAEWDALRMEAGLPDGTRDMIPDKALLLENGFDELGGVDFNKGCYMGQELTARTKYRGLVKKRLLPVRFDGAPPAAGEIVHAGEVEAGEMRSGIDGIGLALLRLEHVRSGAELTCGGKVLRPQAPAWAVLPEAE